MLRGFSGHLVSESYLEAQLEAGGAASDSLLFALRTWRRGCQHLGPASSLRAILDAGASPLAGTLGFAACGPAVRLRSVLAAPFRAGDEPIVLVIAAWGEPLDPVWRETIEHAARLGASWCLFFNGTNLRLADARRLYAPRHADFDLDLALDEPRTFRALVSVVGASGFGALPALILASERHAADVCRSLRSGVLEASAAVLNTLAPRGHAAGKVVYEQSLTVVYRVLFLLFAEARCLVPLWHPIYRESYSMESLCDAAASGRPAPGLWDAIRAVSRLAHAGCRVADLQVTAFNGRLFSPARTPLAERRDLDDAGARQALVALSTRPAPDGGARERIAYRDLGVEELGAVYESLLDYEPAQDAAGPENATRPFVLRRGSGARKATGTFYTPRSIAEFLARRTLEPLVSGASPERILALRVVDPAMGSGAFLVAACHYLTRAYEAALVASGGCHATDIGPSERVLIRRSIAERCLFGVDLNPMAVQLARLSLWLTTLASDRPLTFLDHHLACGDSLLGAWLSCLKRLPRAGRGRAADTLPLFDDPSFADALKATLPLRFTLAETPNDTVEHVRAKERTLAGLASADSALSRWKRVADLWCASWFPADERVPASAFRDLSDFVLCARSALPPATAARCLASIAAVAEKKTFFHWELEFPEVFFEKDGSRQTDGGFDAVLGNPPWDMIRGDAGDPGARASARADAGAVLRFTRDSGVYTSQSDGHANRYQLFLERAIGLTRRGGRIGMVVPSGLASDHGSARLRHRLFSTCAVDAIVGFENTARIFPIHRSVRFHLVTATAGAPTSEFTCRLGRRDTSALEGERANDGIRLTPELLKRLTGDGLAVPDVRSPLDIGIAERAASLFRALGDPDGWGARFGRELNATDDREHFLAAGEGCGVVEGKTIEPFRINLSACRHTVSASSARALLGDRFTRPRLAYRDVASATNRLTLIAAIVPRGAVSTHTVFCLRTPLPLAAQYFLSGLFNSFVVNYLARLRVTTHVTTSIVEQLPIPQEWECPGAFAEIAAAARLLSRGMDQKVFASLNARVADIYRLSRDEFAHVLETFPLMPREERDLALLALNNVQ